ncbi:flagellar basal body rod protein FlgB [Ketobacter sp. MCCC 1A13808]|uniref:flagellar basal body rod protein FlgB n=1 Tax=Ketobacter sp. MCCC 1A13808 TaxID=2602738 RepID=UPI000F202AC3|nr:flagellar basal body rod protein FlgB [Ketobacter sp. MCCC 1A13808]MVF12811.1 flagellar basal body rod protein FlgB [Ketobacter sp. MCCC 1A13808]RLP54515.1 MAG: flagellar basal body rod protein FlgB [Ketobacter sp.]
MAISIDKHFGVAQQALELRSMRANVLANNIANADTPGYKARDIDFQEMLKSRLGETSDSVGINGTHSGHQLTTPQGNTMTGLKFRTPTQPSIDGNTVDAQVEKTQFVQNTIEFQTAFEFMNGKVKSLLTAIRGD